MKLPRRQFLRLAARAVVVIVLSVTFSGHDAWSQASRTIKIVVPYAPGGIADVLARLLAEHIGRVQGRTMLIENRAGAGTVIGTEAVARSAPDGNTLLINTPDLLISPHLRKLNINPMTSLDPICYLTNSPSLIAVDSASPYRTLADLLDAARAKPGELTLASSGPATLQQIAFETLKRVAHIDMSFVPYQGGTPALNAQLGGHVTSILLSYATLAEQLKTGALRALAAVTRKRIEALPDVPTVAEFGYKDYEMDLWEGLFAPTKTPKQTVSQLATWFTAALRAPEIKEKLVILGLFPIGMCGSDFAALVSKQYDEYGRAIRDANIKAE
jgi:tripartite-type tricarboxylate transporter receptor subunit TctC